MEKKTVRQLIEALEKVSDKELVVELDGCDCTGLWNGEIDEENVYYGSGVGYKEKSCLLKRDS